MPWTSRIPSLAAGIEARAELIAAKTAQDIAAGAKQRSRVDTGAMRAGWEAVPHGPAEYEVTDPIEYTIYNELGTVNMSAQPMVIPAAEQARPGFEAAVRSLFR